MVRRNVGSVFSRPVDGSIKRRVVVLPPGLVLLRAAVVVDREQHRRRVDLEAGGAEVHRGLAAVGADLEHRKAGQSARVRQPPASCSASPSSTGMKPFAASAIARSRASTSARFGGGLRVGEQHRIEDDELRRSTARRTPPGSPGSRRPSSQTTAIAIATNNVDRMRPANVRPQNGHDLAPEPVAVVLAPDPVAAEEVRRGSR